MRKTLALLLLLSVLLLVACGSGTEPLDVDAYKRDAADLLSGLIDNTIDLVNICNYESNYITSYRSISGNRPSADLTLESALSWFEEQSGKPWADVDTAHSSLAEMYSDFIAIDTSANAECTDIRDSVKEIYSAYNNIFNEASTGNISSYATSIEIILNTSTLLQSTYLSDYLDPIT